jgi:hypothetical protein
MRVSPLSDSDQVMPAPSHRSLPDDAALHTLDAAARTAVALAWRRRARNELSTSTAFADLTRALVAIDAPRDVVLGIAQAVGDEARHAEICVHVARMYWPECPPPDPSPVAQALVPGEGPFATQLYVVSQSCVNEGVATAYLQRCLAAATSPLARAAVRDIFEDEISHARVGWTLLGSGAVTAEGRAALGAALPSVLNRVAEAWTAEDDGLPEAPAGHGTIATCEMAGVVKEAFEDLILPGFDRVGVDTRAARSWWAARAGYKPPHGG